MRKLEQNGVCERLNRADTAMCLEMFGHVERVKDKRVVNKIIKSNGSGVNLRGRP